MKKSKIVKYCFLLALVSVTGLLLSAVDLSSAWVKVGQSPEIIVRDSSGKIELTAERTATVGLLSKPILLTKGADAVLIEAQVSDARTRAVTFSLHDIRSGETLAYWQNPVDIGSAQNIQVVLPVDNNKRRVRLYVGTHNQPLVAKIKNITALPIHRGVSHRYSIRAFIIDDSNTIRQTFKATGKKLAAVVLRIRELKARYKGPDLRVRLYKWADNVAETVNGKVLAETIVSRSRMPGTLRDQISDTDDADLSATYGAGSRELAVKLSSKTEPGQMYMLELAVTGKTDEDQKLLTWGWHIDGYPDGQLYNNEKPFVRYRAGRKWDLYMETYDADW